MVFILFSQSLNLDLVNALIIIFLLFSTVSRRLGPYSTSIKQTEKEIKEKVKKINDLCGECCLFFSIFVRFES